MNSIAYTCSFTYTNSTRSRLLISLEPSAREHCLEPNGSVRVTGTGGNPGSVFELDQLGDRLIIWAWADAITSIERISSL